MEASTGHTPSGLPQPCVVRFDSSRERYRRLLGGPPDTIAMKAGLVTLEADDSVGEHTTAANEEAIVVLEGVGELRVEGRPALGLAAGSVAYCPPATRHNVVNTGADLLRYVYVVSRADGAHRSP